MAKPAPFTAPTGFKFPKLDLDTVFTTQKANLAVAHEAQSLLIGTVEAITRAQYGHVEQSLASAKAAFAAKQLPKAETFKAAGAQAVAVRREVVSLTVAAQKRVAELLAERN